MKDIAVSGSAEGLLEKSTAWAFAEDALAGEHRPMGLQSEQQMEGKMKAYSRASLG